MLRETTAVITAPLGPACRYMVRLYRDRGIDLVERWQRTVVLYVDVHPRTLNGSDVGRLKPVKQGGSPFSVGLVFPSERFQKLLPTTFE
jgi:hypothetical protein